MQKNHTCKILAIGIICLFIGVGIHPAFAVDIKQSMVNKAGEDECWDCKEVDTKYLVILERQLDRLEVYSKLLLVLSKYNPEVLEDYEKLSYMISTLKEVDISSLICDLILDILLVFQDWGIYYNLKAWVSSVGEGKLIYSTLATFFLSIYFSIYPVYENLCL